MDLISNSLIYSPISLSFIAMVQMVSLSTSTSTSHAHPLPSAYKRRPAERIVTVRCVSISPRESNHTIRYDNSNKRKWLMSTEDKAKEDKNTKIASRKAISTILRREAAKAIIEKKKGPNNSKKLLPRTVLEALHERITALRWESALQVSVVLASGCTFLILRNSIPFAVFYILNLYL